MNGKSHGNQAAANPPVRFELAHRLLERPLVRNLLKVLGGNVVANGMLLFVILILARELKSEVFGLYSALQTAMILIATTTDFGLNTTIVKYYREQLTIGGDAKAEALMRWTGLLRLAIVGVVAISCLILAEPICRHLMKAPEATRVFRWVCIGAIGQSLWFFTQSALQARERFTLYSWLNVVNSMLRLGLILALLWGGWLNLELAVIVLVVVPYITAAASFVGWPAIFWSARIAAAELRVIARDIFHFSKWIFLSTLICSFITRLDVMMLTAFTTKQQVGHYSVAAVPATALPLITLALSTVLLPKLSTSRSRRHILQTLRAARKLIIPVVLLIAVMQTAAHLLWVPILGEEYRSAVWVFDALVVAYSITIFVNPLSYFCFAFGRAYWLTLMNIIQLGICVLLNWLLIPRFGAMGSGISALGVYVFSLFFILATIPRLLRLAESEPDPAGGVVGAVAADPVPPGGNPL